MTQQPQNTEFHIAIHVNQQPQNEPPCTDGSPPAPVEAIILYPSLGTPLVLSPDQKYCCIYLAAPPRVAAHFGVEKRTQPPVSDGASSVNANGIHFAPCAYSLIDRHLRLVSMQCDKPTDANMELGMLYGGSYKNSYDLARQAIRTWQVAAFMPHALIRDRFGRHFATLSPHTVAAYPALQGGHVYAVELDLTRLVKPITSAEFLSFAWMVPVVKSTEASKDEEVGGFKRIIGQTYHYQDRLIARFLHQQQARQHHLPDVREYDMTLYSDANRFPETATTMLRHKTGGLTLAAWHPVIRASNTIPLKLGHLTDVHVNVRHQALANSPAQVIEDLPASENDPDLATPVGKKVCNSFLALKHLFDQMSPRQQPDTALLLTGDLIDFNRNVVPRSMDSYSTNIGQQWKNFNVLNNIDDPNLYQRGQDDMLVYSLIRYAYTERRLPVFMTTGNHEAYQIPYGISPRKNNRTVAVGLLEKGGSLPEHQEGTPYGRNRALVGTPTLSERLNKVAVNIFTDTAITELEHQYRDMDSASQWADGKANDGIAADHNLTIYEATLAYGPSYPQALTSNNFQARQLDWFSTLFTPLTDVVITLGNEANTAQSPARQIITALGWGDAEEYVNLSTGYAKVGVDQQGLGILPRAPHAINPRQLTLLRRAQREKQQNPNAPFVVATHFTMLNYDMALPLKLAKPPTLTPSNSTGGAGAAGFTAANFGTCEQHVGTYFSDFVYGAANSHSRAQPSPSVAVDWHFSGHSHRAGVYEVTKDLAVTGRQIEISISANDPAFTPISAHVPQTQFIVSSCGGPIGVQNFEGELNGWTLRPPSGTLLDPLSGKITQITSKRFDLARGYNEQPRLAVALDYLTLTNKGSSADNDRPEIAPSHHAKTPLRFEHMTHPTKLDVYFNHQLAALECIERIDFWVFEGSEQKLITGDNKTIKTWHKLSPTYSAIPDKDKVIRRAQLTFTKEHIANLKAALAAGIVRQIGGAPRRTIAQAFCAVKLKKPADRWFWANDMRIGQGNPETWVFPIDISISGTEFQEKTFLTPNSALRFHRSAGERGEVPDWDWLAETFPEKGYITSKEAISDKKGNA